MPPPEISSDIASMPEPPKRKGLIKPVGSFSEMNRKLAIIEDRLQTLRDHIALVEKDSLEKTKALAVEVHEYDEKIDVIRKEIEKIESMIERIVSKLELFASKEQLKVLERYLNFWNPLDYVTKKDVEELINEKLKSHKSQSKSKKTKKEK